MTTIHPGDVWITRIPFTDMLTTKKRPALVLWLDSGDVALAPITSFAPRTQTDVALNDWKLCGLRSASTVRLARIVILEQSLLLYHAGSISASDAQQLKDIWAQHIKPQF